MNLTTHGMLEMCSVQVSELVTEYNRNMVTVERHHDARMVVMNLEEVLAACLTPKIANT